MGFEAERARIETHFRDGWAATPFAPVAIEWENSGIKQPAGADFLIHRIVSGDGTQMEVVGTGGPVLHRYVGLVQVDILTTPGSGSAAARRMGDAVAGIYRRQQLVDAAGGVITFRTPSIRSMGAAAERYRFVVTAPFHRDIRE